MKHQVKDRPIMMSGPMVRAIQEGRKTQTRRIVKFDKRMEFHPKELELNRMQGGYPDGCRPVFGFDDEPNAFSVRNPYGKVGDRLWVRETFFNSRMDDSMPTHYRADEKDEDFQLTWKPSIFMPRWASRITLKLVNVGVERLQDISEEDARAEGISELPLQEGQPGAWFSADAANVKLHARTASDAFRLLWDSINGKRPGRSWADNPWVWKLTFKNGETIILTSNLKPRARAPQTSNQESV